MKVFKTIAIVLAGVLATACDYTFDRGRTGPEPAAAGALLDLTGRIIGPQPGPDRRLAELDNPYGLQPNALTEGRRLFVWFNCYGCHGGRGGGGMGPSLRDGRWRYGSSDAAIFDSIAVGRQFGMPAWGTKLPVEQMWKITSYIRSLGTDMEPDPPPPNPATRSEHPIPPGDA